MSDVIPPILYCANHPQRETSLRCNRCEKPICPDCAILTPTGYRCKECVRGHQQKFNTATWIDYVLAFITAASVSYISSLITSFLSFFMLILAPFAGIVVAEAVRWVIKKRRSPGLFMTATVATALGSLPGLVLPLISLIPELFISRRNFHFRWGRVIHHFQVDLHCTDHNQHALSTDRHPIENIIILC